MNNNIVFFIGVLVIAGLMLCVFDFVVESAVLYLFNRFDEYEMPYLSDFVSGSSIWDVSKFIAELFVGEQSAARHASKSIAETLGGISALLVISATAFLLLCILIRMWLIKISVRFCDNEKGRYSDLFSCFTLYIRVLLSCLLYLLVVFLGICLFLIPGIIWAIKFRFFACLIVDKGLTPIKAFKKSWAITRGVKWRLVIFFVVLGLINVLGAFCFGVGLFATIPITTLAMAFTYRRLLSEAEAASTLQAWPRLTRRKLVALVVVFGMFALFSYVILCHEAETSCIKHVRWVCQFNLEKIIKAIDMYRQDHGGSLPPDLNSLCIASYLEEKIIRCPSAISGKSARYEYIRVGPGEAGKYSRGAEKIPDASYRVGFGRRRIPRSRSREKRGEPTAIVRDSDTRNHAGLGRLVIIYHSDGGIVRWIPEGTPIKLTAKEHRRWIPGIKKLCREQGYHYWYNAFFRCLISIVYGFAITVVIGCAVVFLGRKPRRTDVK